VKKLKIRQMSSSGSTSGPASQAGPKNENEYIAQEIRKSGFPLEIETAAILEAHGWEVIPSLFYHDCDDEFKEIDLIAYKTMAKSLRDSPNYPFTITTVLVVECKKREGLAWVFFPRLRDPNDVDYGGVGLAAVDSFQVARISSITAAGPRLRLRHRPIGFGLELRPKAFVPVDIAKQIWAAHEQPGLVEARCFRCLSTQEKSLSYDVVKLAKPKQGEKLQRDSERREIHGALTGLAKAVEERLIMEADLLENFLEGALYDSETQPHLRQFFLAYFFPVLVLDGRMKSWRNGVVTDANEMLYEAHLRSRYYFRNRLVSVITGQHFGRWLSQFESDANALVQKIVTNRDKLDKEVELLERYRSEPPQENL